MTETTEIDFKGTVTNVKSPSNASASKTFNVLSYTPFGGTDLSWLAPQNRGLIKLTSPLGVTYNNTNVTAPDIIPTTSTFDPSDVSVISAGGTDIIKSPLPAGVITGSPIVFEFSGGLINAVPAIDTGKIYFARIETTTEWRVFENESDAILGNNPIVFTDPTATSATVTYMEVTIPMPTNADGSIVKGAYQAELTYFDDSNTGVQFFRTMLFTYDYEQAVQKIKTSYSIFNPAFLTAIDETDYSAVIAGGSTPLQSNRVFTLNYPQGLGSYTTDASTLTTSGFYAGNPATHGITLAMDLKYYVPGVVYADGGTSERALYIYDYATCADQINVFATSSSCDLYNCLFAANERMVAAEGTAAYKKLRNDFVDAESIVSMIDLAFNCNKSEDVVKLREQFFQITNCTSNCQEQSVDAVISIGILPSVTRKVNYEFPSDSASYQSDDLIGLSWTSGSFLFTVDGLDVASSSLNSTTTFNSETGTMNFGVTLTTGTLITWWRLQQ